MAPARVEVAPSDRVATTMTRVRRLARPSHGSGRACPCHASSPCFVVELKHVELLTTLAGCSSIRRVERTACMRG